MAQTEPLTTDVDPELKRRLKVYSAVTGQTIRSLLSQWLDEKLPPLPPAPETGQTAPEAVA